MKFSCLQTVQSSYFFCKNSLPLSLSTFSSISILFFICSAISIQLYLPPSHNHHFPSSPFMFDCKSSGWPNTLQVPVLWSRSKPRSQVTRWPELVHPLPQSLHQWQHILQNGLWKMCWCFLGQTVDLVSNTICFHWALPPCLSFRFGERLSLLWDRVVYSKTIETFNVWLKAATWKDILKINVKSEKLFADGCWEKVDHKYCFYT